MDVKNINISSTLLCLGPLNFSFKLNFNIWQVAAYATRGLQCISNSPRVAKSVTLSFVLFPNKY